MQPVKRLVSLILLGAISFGAVADDYPSKPIRIVVPYAAGSGVDLIGRVTATKLQDELKAAVIVENRPGGNALIGSAAVARAPADGYTLLMAGAGTHSSSNALYKNVPYDVEKDFQPIS
ncbi:MAG: tripartite tricarboxylate transporter substrate binding protein, partial [Comamonadaceae bacterium]